jgi:cell division protein FtsB
MRKNGLVNLLLVAMLGLAMTGCQDTKARQENDQLKTQVAELQKENADLSTRVDALAKENSALSSENEKLKAIKTPPKKSAKSKHRKHRSTASNSN